jgi:hypothetical protein
MYTICVMLFKYEELLPHTEPSKRQDHPLSAVSDYLFNTLQLSSLRGALVFRPQSKNAPCRGGREPEMGVTTCHKSSASKTDLNHSYRCEVFIVSARCVALIPTVGNLRARAHSLLFPFLIWTTSFCLASPSSVPCTRTKLLPRTFTYSFHAVTQMFVVPLSYNITDDTADIFSSVNADKSVSTALWVFWRARPLVRRCQMASQILLCFMHRYQSFLYEKTFSYKNLRISSSGSWRSYCRVTWRQCTCDVTFVRQHWP